MEKTKNNKPTNVFSCGQVKAAVWKDSKLINNEMVEVYSIKIDKSYKDNAGDKWKHTNTFNPEDLPKVAVAAMEAYKFLRLRTYEESPGLVE